MSQDEGRRSDEGELEGDFIDMEGPSVAFGSKCNPLQLMPLKLSVIEKFFVCVVD